VKWDAPEACLEKTDYICLYRHENAGQNHNKKGADINLAEFVHLKTTVTNQNYSQEEIKSGLNFGNASCYEDQNRALGTLTAVKIQINVFWVVTPCSVVVGYQGFGGPCCLHIHFTLKT
jgi:hypothetical protein